MGFTKLDLDPGEVLLMSGAANKWQTFGSKGGCLFLTNKRIVFKAHALNFGSKFEECALSQIATQGNTVNIEVTSNGFTYNISFYTKSGEVLSFVVSRKQKDEWVKQISAAVAQAIDSSDLTITRETPNKTKSPVSPPQTHAADLVTPRLIQNIPDNQSSESNENVNNKPKRVVRCEGCGAFVIVPIGEVVRCGCCGRPTS